MYAACFELDNHNICVAALLAPHGSFTLVPKPWQAALLASRRTGFALRLTHSGGERQGLILIHGESAEEVRALGEQMLATIPPAEGARAAADKADFDKLGACPPQQLWLNHHGYAVKGRALATDFRLYPLVEPLAALPALHGAEFVYQCNFTPLTPDKERDRATKYLIASLKLDNTLPRAIADLQQALAARLLTPGFLCEEFLALPNAAALSATTDFIEQHFAETMGKMGFARSPLEEGDFNDFLLTGLGSGAFEKNQELLAQAATAFSIEDARRMLDLRLAAPLATGVVGDSSGKGPAVFVSYSSRDFALASATCQYLEANGISCWLAPRNINPGEPYPDAIARGLQACRALVLVFSSASNLSVHVHREIEIALSRRAVIIPMRVENVEPTEGMRYLIGMCQRLDAFDEFDRALSQLLARLRAQLAA